MSKRYWCPQAWSEVKGWIDLPSLAFQAQKKANIHAKRFAEDNCVVTRVFRKPHGWEPRAPEPVTPTEPNVIKDQEPEDTGVSTPPEPLPEDSSNDRYRLEEETKKGNQPCAVRLSRLMVRDGQYEQLLELSITSYYMGWDQLFCEIMEKLPGQQKGKLRKFIQQTGDQEFIHLFEETQQ